MNNAEDETARRVREILTAVHAQIAVSRKLCEMSQNLQQQNADLRELLRENLLVCWSKREH
jgi:hypothetical protein